VLRLKAKSWLGLQPNGKGSALAEWAEVAAEEQMRQYTALKAAERVYLLQFV
jgi:hypothetical protein